MEQEPALSVITLVGPQRERAERMLRSVLGQSIVDQMEVLLVDFEAGTMPPLPGSAHAHVRPLQPGADTSFGTVRANAVRAARAPVVAFLEEHAVAFPGWAEAIVRAHAEGWAGVTGEVHSGNPHVGISDGVALVNFPQFMPPVERGETRILPGHNATYKRDALLAYGDLLDSLLMAEITLQWKLLGDGHRFLIEPDIKMAHYNETSLSSIVKGLYHINRCLGVVRAEVFHWRLWQRALRVVLSPLNPWRRVARLFAYLARHRSEQVATFVRYLPTIIVCEHSSVAGHTAGLLFGMGRADVKFRVYETSEPRAEPENSTVEYDGA